MTENALKLYKMCSKDYSIEERRCRGALKQGDQCSNAAIPGYIYCGRHNKNGNLVADDKENYLCKCGRFFITRENAKEHRYKDCWYHSPNENQTLSIQVIAARDNIYFGAAKIRIRDTWSAKDADNYLSEPEILFVLYLEKTELFDSYDQFVRWATRRMPYREYLNTGYWRRNRNAAYHRADSRCQICNTGRPDKLNAHHRCYANVGTPSETDDLIMVCKKCHAMIHDNIKIGKDGRVDATLDALSEAPWRNGHKEVA